MKKITVKKITIIVLLFMLALFVHGEVKKELIEGVFSENKAENNVYCTLTGEKYHCIDCRYLRKSCIQISIIAAEKAGMEACSICLP